MSQDIQNQLFTIQENASRQGTALEKGQGLGLILVKDMIEANNGTLRVESVENQGTVISINFK
jgi:signal transduction histidine kinase